jgi:DNA polymerase III delta prime subunit
MFSLGRSSPNLIVCGPFGSGKTSLVIGILKEINVRKRIFQFLIIKELEDEKSFKTKEKIGNFITSAPPGFFGTKVIIIEGMDSFSMNNQMGLRESFEKNYLERRFLATCNSLSKVNLAVFSRCGLIRLNFPPPFFLMVRLKEISEKEKINICLEDLKRILDSGMGNARTTIEFLSMVPFQKKNQGLFRPASNWLRRKRLLKIYQEIFLKDFQFVAFKKIKEIHQGRHFSFFEFIENSWSKKKINVSFFQNFFY